MWEDSDEWGDHWVPPPRSDPDYLISRWLKEQPHQQLDPEAKWETEAAERDQILRDFHWAREESPGGIISSLLKHLFLPLKVRKPVRRVEHYIWQKMLLLAPDVMWGILFAVLVSAVVVNGPVVSWEEESPWRSLQAITSSLLLYWVTCVVLVRVVNDWRFRRRLHWWATQGYTEAEFSLGSLYEAGDGIPANPRVAAHWFHKAARHGHCEAQYMLGECYFRGYGVPVNLREARKWFQRAANQGDEDAEIMEEYIKKLLESPGSTGIGGGAKAGTGDLPFRTSAKNGSIEHGNGLQVGKGKGTKGSVTAECDKQQLQRKEEQRKEYERQEALRKQQATEKRKAKADKARKERQLREKQEAAAAAQAAEIAALVAEESRHRHRRTTVNLPVKKSASHESSATNALNGPKASKSEAAPPKRKEQPPQSSIENADAAAELIAQQEILERVGTVRNAKAQDSPAASSSSRQVEDTISRQAKELPTKLGKENCQNQPCSSGGGVTSSSSGSYAIASARASPMPQAQSSAAQCPGQMTSQVHRQGSWPPRKGPDFLRRTRDEQVAALTVPPPPPPPGRPKPAPSVDSNAGNAKQQPRHQRHVSSPQSDDSREPNEMPRYAQMLYQAAKEGPGAQGSDGWSQGGWSPLLSTDLNWHPVEDLLGQTTRKGPEVRSPDKQMQGLLRKDRIPQHSPDAQPSMDLVALGARDVLQRSLSAVAAHYMQRAEWMPMACPAQPNFEGGPALKPAAFKPPPPPEPIMQQSHMWAVFPGASYAGSQPDSEEENVCIICLDRKPGGAALVPCGHTQLCLPCARALLGSIHGCPICRSPIQDLLEIRD